MALSRSVALPIAPWLLVPGVIVAKKIIAYKVAQHYGFHRIYRQLLKINKTITHTEEQRKTNAAAIQSMFRLPENVVKTSNEMATRMTFDTIILTSSVIILIVVYRCSAACWQN